MSSGEILYNRLISIEGSPILVWPFCDAPEEFQKLSPHGGDEDWVAFVAVGVETPGWVDRLGVCDTSAHELEGGHRVYIGAHA